MSDSPAPVKPLEPPTDHLAELQVCRAMLSEVMIQMVRAQGRMRRALAVMPANETQATLAKSAQQRFQVSSEPLRSLVLMSAHIEAYLSGGNEAEIQNRIAGNMLKKLARSNGGLAVVVEDGIWSFRQDEDPAMLTAKAKLDKFMAEHAKDETQEPA